jgi:hypothetical protein
MDILSFLFIGDIWMSEWQKYYTNVQIDSGIYLVRNEQYFNWPMLATYDGFEFVIGPNKHELPASLPVNISHYLKIPEWN